MAKITDKTVKSKYPPKQTNVTWIDTSQKPAVTKSYIDGQWVVVGGGVTDYNDIKNKPSINGVELDGNKTSSDLGVYSKPSSGIPQSDLSSDVQSQLNKHFKGWYDTLDKLKAEHTATDGDSAYVKDASPATTWSIYVYDSTASSDNYWADSGTDADTSNVQTFASSQEVNEVHIVNDLTTGGVDNVLSAEQGKKIGNEFKIAFGKISAIFDFSTGSVSAYASRYIDYTFENGKSYQIIVKTTNSTTETYFSLRNTSGEVVNSQNNILQGSGARQGVYECTADAERLYLTYKTSGPSIIYDVDICDLNALSIYNNDESIVGELLHDSLEGIKYTESIVATGTKRPLKYQLYPGFKLTNLKGLTLDSEYIELFEKYNSTGDRITKSKFPYTVTKKYSAFSVYKSGAPTVSFDVEYDGLNSTSDSTRFADFLLQGNTHLITVPLSKTGYYIDTNGEKVENSSYFQSEIIALKKHESVVCKCCGTSSTSVFIVKTNESGSVYQPAALMNNVVQVRKYTADEDCYIIIQASKYDMLPYIYMDYQRILGIEDRLTKVEDSLPDYTITEIKRIYNELIQRLNNNATVIAFNTDQHFSTAYYGTNNVFDPKYTIRSLRGLLNIAKRLPLDLIVFGGDAVGYDYGNSSYGEYSGTIEGIFDEINVLNENFMELNNPIISIPGNHDVNNTPNMTAQGMYNVHYKRSKQLKNIVHNGTDNCDSYFDDDDKKIRYIFIDVYSTNGRTESPQTFLENALSTMDVSNGYKAIIFSHNPLTTEFNGIYTVGSNNQNAFYQGASWGAAILGNYSQYIIACISGHAHCDASAVSATSGILYIETTSLVHTRSHINESPMSLIPYQYTLGTITENAFDFFVIDTANETIEAVRFGQGTNRKWKYGENAGLISYKNCVSGTSSEPSVTLVFTNAEDNTDIVSAVCDAKGNYEVYLQLGEIYNITCGGYTLDVSSVEITGNQTLDLELTQS